MVNCQGGYPGAATRALKSANNKIGPIPVIGGTLALPIKTLNLPL